MTNKFSRIIAERIEEEVAAGLASTYQATDGDLPDTLLTDETSEEFWSRELAIIFYESQPCTTELETEQSGTGATAGTKDIDPTPNQQRHRKRVPK